MLAPKTWLGGYRIERLIGQGGYGEVYLAYDPKLGRQVALKLLSRQQFWGEPEKYQKARKRFEREAKIITSLQHVAIVPVLDFGEDQGYSFIVMRLMKGRSLANALENGPLQLDEIVRILTWLAPALDKVHRERIIHRDLKPSNILFDEDRAPYIADFGIAKLIGANTELTGSEARIGTGYYMSPEQARGDKKIDGRSDLYSLGATLFEMLTGKPPYHRVDPLAVYYFHIHEPVPQLNELRPDLPHEFQAIIERAMAKKPEDRYATAREFAEVVKGIVDKKKQEAQQARHQAQLERLRRQAEWEKQQREAAERERAKLERQLRRRQPTPPPIKPTSLPSQPTNQRSSHSSISPPRPIAPSPPRRSQPTNPPSHQPSITPTHQPSIKRLSAWNPLDHSRLLWWTLMKPQQLKAHREQFGKKAERPIAKWLVSTLLWLPFLLPFSAVGLQIIPFSLDSEPLTATHYLWASGCLFIAWLLTGLFGDRDERVGGLVGDLAVVLAVVLGGVLAVILAGELGGGLGGGLAPVLAVGVGGGIAVGVALVLAVVLSAALAAVLAVALAVGLAPVLAVALAVGLAPVLAVGATVGMGGALVGLAVVLEDALKESLKTGRAFWKTKGAFWLLVVANAFLVWYSYLGGWRVF